MGSPVFIESYKVIVGANAAQSRPLRRVALKQVVAAILLDGRRNMGSLPNSVSSPATHSLLYSQLLSPSLQDQTLFGHLNALSPLHAQPGETACSNCPGAGKHRCRISTTKVPIGFAQILIYTPICGGIVVFSVNQDIVTTLSQASLPAVYQWIDGQKLLVHIKRSPASIYHQATIDGKA